MLMRFRVVMDCADWPGYPGQSRACNHHALITFATEISAATVYAHAFQGCHLIVETDLDTQASHAHAIIMLLLPLQQRLLRRLCMLMPFRVVIWLWRLTWISRAVTRMQSSCSYYLCNRDFCGDCVCSCLSGLSFDCGDWPGYPGQSRACNHHALITFATETSAATVYAHAFQGCHLIVETDLDIQGSHAHAIIMLLLPLQQRFLRRLCMLMPFRVVIWLWRLTWIPRPVTRMQSSCSYYLCNRDFCGDCVCSCLSGLSFDCGDWPGYPGQSRACNHHALITFATEISAATVYSLNVDMPMKW